MLALHELLQVALQYEKDGRNLKAYISKANAVFGTNHKDCNSCAALMKRYNGEFQRKLWMEMMKEDARYVPSLPKFETVRLNTEYTQKALVVMSLEDLKANENNCRTEMLKARKNGNPVDEARYAADEIALRNYRISKLAYFDEFLPELERSVDSAVAHTIELESTNNNDVIEEVEHVEKKRRERIIDIAKLFELKDSGMTHQECADHFGVVKSAISKALKEHKYDEHKSKEDSNS
jgi:hypothetical protein